MSQQEIDNKLKSIVSGSKLIARMKKSNPNVYKSELLYFDMLTAYYTRLMNAKKEGKFIAAHTVFFPTEILYAMDIVPMHTESSTCTWALYTGQCAELLASGAELGLASEIWGAHRSLAGAVKTKALPRPDAMVWSNMICDNSAKGGELIMKLTGCPGFFVDHPYGHSDEEKKYLVNELRGMIDFLEKESGNKMNWNRLAEIVERMNRQIKLFREINELRKAVPSPFGPQRFLELVSIDYLFPGQPEAIEYLETLRGELEDMVKQKKGATSPERFRLMTMFIPPLHLSAFLTEISIEYGAVSVTEPFFTLFESGELDPARPLESVAQKSFMLPEMLACGPLDQNTIDSFVQCARDYKVDGVIYYADVGCRQSCACIKIFKDAFNDIDVPMLTLDCDIIDDTVVTKEEVREKLTHFFELLEERR